MSECIVVLTETELAADDAARVLSLHPGERLRYHVLLPADPRSSVLVDVLEDLSLLDMRQMLSDLTPSRREEEHERHTRTAEERLATTLAAFRSAGADVSGTVTTDNPLPALGEAAAGQDAREVVVVTRPHAVQDTFHTDWASVARQSLDLPVLHLYAGSDFVG